MPERKTIERAHKDAREGKSPSTQAGEFVREEIEHVREGKHGARNAQQAIAIGLSKARRAGVALPPPGRNQTNETRRQATRDTEHGRKDPQHKPAATRSRATSNALKREGGAAVSQAALSRQGRSAAASRTAEDRSRAAHKAAKTKGPGELKEAAQKAARTRAAGAGQDRAE